MTQGRRFPTATDAIGLARIAASVLGITVLGYPVASHIDAFLRLPTIR